MQRIKVNLPKNFYFSTVLQVRISDINYGGHVGNDSFLSLIHEARLQFLQHHNYSELNFENVGLIMIDVALEFKRELNYGNKVKISVTANNFDEFGFDIFYLLELINNEQTVIAGKAKTGMLCYDYTQKKITPTPKAAIEKLTKK
ncbi:MAG: thioesterase family protein [Chitinophagales bacterium]|nr:thioesterase family protein [Chitinophagales bacterium]